jgi:hypothetical protein
LFFTTIPSWSCLFWKIHLVPIALCPFGLSMSSHTWFLMKLFNSSYIALTHSTSLKASYIFLGSRNQTYEKCSQNETNFDLVCTPLEISPIIVSNGWSLVILVH